MNYKLQGLSLLNYARLYIFCNNSSRTFTVEYPVVSEMC